MDTNNTPQDADQTRKQDPLLLAPEEIRVTAKDKLLVITIVIVLVVIAAIAVAGFLFMKPGPDVVQGQADATEVRISGKLPGRVEDIYVTEGQHVSLGDTLIHIRSTLAEARLAQAQSGVQVARATNAKVDAGTRSQIINSAYEVWQQAIAAENISKKTYDRMENLFAKGVVTEQKRDEAKAAWQASHAGALAAKSQYELAKSGAQKEDKAAATAMVNVAKGSVKEVNALMEDQYLLAPCDGEVTVIYPNVSELVATGAPLMSLQTDDRWAVFNVRETMLKNIRNGSKLRVRIPALDVETEMEVFYIRDLGTYANWQATKATGDFDARTFEIKARPLKPVDGLRPGMSVVLMQ